MIAFLRSLLHELFTWAGLLGLAAVAGLVLLGAVLLWLGESREGLS